MTFWTSFPSGRFLIALALIAIDGFHVGTCRWGIGWFLVAWVSRRFDVLVQMEQVVWVVLLFDLG